MVRVRVLVGCACIARVTAGADAADRPSVFVCVCVGYKIRFWLIASSTQLGILGGNHNRETLFGLGYLQEITSFSSPKRIPRAKV